MSGNTPGGWLKHAARQAVKPQGNEANDLRVPCNITLIPLPSYSPDLNPVERLWVYLKWIA